MRKGMTCQQCHDASDKELFKDSLPVDMKLSESATDYLIELSWTSSASAIDASIMLDNNQVTAFQKTGCWASCHGDLEGMDQSMGLPKYLGASRQKLSRSGGGKNYQPDAMLEQLMSKGEYVELWHVVAKDGTTKVSQQSILKSPQPINNGALTAKALQKDGRWTVTFMQPKNASTGKALIAEGSYTAGIALHLSEGGHGHWVSLPLNLELKNGKLSLINQ
ncbi:MAG: hypothetical protein R3208_13300 [Ketobacteraceae bacterium]|nr:hypothetical protein [Ketobacteraceae bacterium]